MLSGVFNMMSGVFTVLSGVFTMMSGVFTVLSGAFNMMYFVLIDFINFYRESMFPNSQSMTSLISSVSDLLLNQ